MASVSPMSWSCSQNLGIFQSDLSKIVEALNLPNFSKRTVVDKYVVLDRAGDPSFPDKGAFKKIYYCVFAPQKQCEFTVFIAAKDSINSTQFKKERRVLTLMKNTSAIVTPLLIRAVGSDGYIISELYNRGNLYGYIRQPDFKRGALSTHLIGYAIIQALGECHARGIVLRDLKSDNILVRELEDGSFESRLIDFGMAYIKGEDSDLEATRHCGSPTYMSEEDLFYYLQKGVPYPADFSRDLWALGSILHQLATKALPDQPKHEANFTPLGVFHHEIIDLVYSDRAARPTLSEIQRRMFRIITARFPKAPEVQRLTFSAPSTPESSKWAEVRSIPASYSQVEKDEPPVQETGCSAWFSKLCS